MTWHKLLVALFKEGYFLDSQPFHHVFSKTISPHMCLEETVFHFGEDKQTSVMMGVMKKVCCT